MRVIDLTGRKFGKLTVLKRSKSNNHGARWLCSCDCGKETIKDSWALQVGESKSCGCSRYDWKRQPFGVASARAILRGYQRRAKRSNRSWRLSDKQFYFLTAQDCAYCGRKPVTKNDHGRYNGAKPYNGIDRLNNKIGYVFKNCVPCCASCNYAKGRLSFDYFLDVIKRVYEFQRMGEDGDN